MLRNKINGMVFNRNFLLTISVLIPIIIFYRVVSSFFATEEVAIKKATEKEEKLFRESAEMFSMRQILQADKKEFKEYLSAKKIDDKKTFSIFLKIIESYSRKNELSIMSLSPKDSGIKKGSVYVYSIDLKLEGSEKNIRAFLSDIENSSSLLTFQNLSIYSKDEIGIEQKLDCILEMYVFG